MKISDQSSNGQAEYSLTQYLAAHSAAQKPVTQVMTTEVRPSG
jgi:hypothetical protein